MSVSITIQLKQNPFVVATSLLALCGWIIAFSGACTLKVLNGAWWVMIFELLVTTGNIMIFVCGSVQQYRIAMMAILASSIPLLTIQVDYVIQYTKANIPKSAATAYVSGYIILLAVQYSWILVFGSDQSTFLGRLGSIVDHDTARNEGRGFEPKFYSEKTDESRLSPPSGATYNPANKTLYSVHSGTSVNTIATTAGIQKMSSPVEFTEQVQALHTYDASAQDPNELSFGKGEILEIVNRKGNWWQARKQDGAIGIVPSNYFAQR